MSDNRQRWKARHEATRVRQGGGWWKPAHGSNRLRLVPFMHTVRKVDFAMYRYMGGVKEGEVVEELFLNYAQHFRPKPQLCGLVRGLDGKLHGECSICDQAKTYKSTGDSDDKRVAASWKPQVKNVLIIVDEADPSQYRIWEAPSSVMNYVTESMDKAKYEDDVLAGKDAVRDLLIEFNEQATTPLGYYSFDWSDRGDVMEIAWNTLGTPPDPMADVKYIPDCFHHLLDKDGSEKPKASTKPTKKKTTKKVKEPEPEEEEEVEEEESSEGFAKGDTVTFEDEEGDTLEGEVTSDDLDEDGDVSVRVGNSIYGVAPEELSKVG